MTATDTAWLVEHLDYGPEPSPQDLKEFFGVPPSPESELEGNIREKRKYWKGQESRSRVETGREIAKAVLQAIQEAEHALLRGSDVETSGPVPEFAPTGPAKSIDDIFNEIEQLLFRGRHSDALDRLGTSEADWGKLSRFKDLRARVILDVLEQRPDLLHGHSAVQSAIDDARSAIDELGPEEARYLILVDLLEASGKRPEADQAFEEGLQKIEKPSPHYRVRELVILTRSATVDQLIVRALRFIDSAEGDADARSSVVQMLVTKAEGVLPLTDPTRLAQYISLVDAAAWAAIGIPEAENAVRPHRMWAASAGQKVFSGNWQWRALVAVLTGFIALPVFNIMLSKPAYQILLLGPAKATTKKLAMNVRAQNRAYFMVTRNNYVEHVHAKAKLPWQSVRGQFYEIDNAEALFDF